MTTFIKSTALLLALGLAASPLHAQQTPPPPPPKPELSGGNENIIIRKKGGSDEKLTIIVDGDKITVNGKPIDQFKNDHIEIIRGEDGDMDMPAMPGMDAMPPMPPMGQMGEMKMMGNDFMKEMHGNKAFLGVMTEKSDDGAKITDVTKESAAEKAGLKPGDVITKIGDDKIATADDLYKAVGKYHPDEKVNITYKRDGKEATTSATLSKNTEAHIYNFNWNKDGDAFNYKMMQPRIEGMNGFNVWDKKPRLGLQVQDTDDGKGVKVLDVDDESPAAKAGLKEDDIITQINGKQVASVDDLMKTVKDAKDGDIMKLTFLRNNQTQTVDVKFPKDLKTVDL